jgi:hypothetical protein
MRACRVGGRARGLLFIITTVFCDSDFFLERARLLMLLTVSFMGHRTLKEMAHTVDLFLTLGYRLPVPELNIWIFHDFSPRFYRF